MSEVWKTIKGFEAYQVSNMGRVCRILPSKGTYYGRMLTRTIASRGYLRVHLHKNGKRSGNILVHVLVAKAFIPNFSNLPQVNHKDGDKENCKASNLEWKTQEGNMRHSTKLRLRGDCLKFDKRSGKWEARYSPEPYKLKTIGTFATKEEALAARLLVIKSLPDIP